MRDSIPREDGYDPLDGDRARFGHHWQENANMRKRILESHPKYNFLSRMATYAKIPDVAKMFNLNASRATEVRIQRQIIDQRIDEASGTSRLFTKPRARYRSRSSK